METAPDKSRPRPLDIKPDWDNVTRVAQSACHDNRGLACITMRVYVRGTDVLFFGSPEVSKIGPLNGAASLTSETMEALALFLLDPNEEGFYLSKTALREMALGQNKKETHVRPE